MPSKEVLARAKKLGLNVNSPSSTVDKISAEYLEEVLRREFGLGGPQQGLIESQLNGLKQSLTEQVNTAEQAGEAAQDISPQIKESLPTVPSEAGYGNFSESGSETIEQPIITETEVTAECTSPDKPTDSMESTFGSAPVSTIPEHDTQQPALEPEEALAVEDGEPSLPESAGLETTKNQGGLLQDQVVQKLPESETKDRIEAKEIIEAQEEEEEQEQSPEQEADVAPEAVAKEQHETSQEPRVQKVGFIDISKFKSQQQKEPDRWAKKKEKHKQKGKPHKAKALPPKGTKPRPGSTPTQEQTRPRLSLPSKPTLPPMPPLETLTEGEVVMRPPIVVRDLAAALGKRPHQIIADLMEWGFFLTVNQVIEDPEVARRLCAKYKKRFRLERRGDKTQSAAALAAKKRLLMEEGDRPQDLKPRPPVVTIMGHVDHGKTTLLDAIRKSNIAATEAGQITQHIGAYTITIPHPERKKELARITFIDTPGHEAFSAMRARGANVTDIVVLVVAADDGVMPQTIEALQHAQAAGVPIIVAVNKIDAPGANPMKVRQQLQNYGLVPDEWGGNTFFVDISALKRQNIDKLLELILFQAELMELKANPNRRAKGNVIESSVERAGPTATLLVRTGTLRVGDPIVCGTYYGKVRALIDDWGNRVSEAGPGIAVKVIGLNGAPEPGLEFVVVPDEKTAREIAEQRAEQEEMRKAQAAVRRPQEFTELLRVIEEESKKVLRLVIKGDTQGTAEAIAESIKKIQSDQVRLDILTVGLGSVSENDVLLASASNAVIVGFNVKVDPEAATLAKQRGVQIKLYSIIYHLLDEVKQAMQALVEPEYKEVIQGEAEIKRVFQLSKAGTVAGCVVRNGQIIRNGKVRLIRNGQVLFDGNIASLKHLKDDVQEVRAGMECGIRLEGFTDFQEGDLLQCYTVERTAKDSVDIGQ